VSLAIDGLEVRYGHRIAVATASLRLERRRVVALVGPNGAGKSSLLKAIAGLVPRTGVVTWEQQILGPDHPRRLARTLAYLPQSPAAHWPLRTADLVALGRLPHRPVGMEFGSADQAAVRWAMRATGIDTLAERSVDQLSGGERARVQLARALAVRAPVLLVDEPVASLDPYHQLHMMQVLADYAAEDALVLIVMHDLTLGARFADRMVLMHDGRIVADGTPADVLEEATLQRYYRVHTYIGTHDGQPVVVPWRTIA
jgi:iron complex transport system ATP-binding protein